MFLNKLFLKRLSGILIWTITLINSYSLFTREKFWRRPKIFSELLALWDSSLKVRNGIWYFRESVPRTSLIPKETGTGLQNQKPITFQGKTLGWLISNPKLWVFGMFFTHKCSASTYRNDLDKQLENRPGLPKRLVALNCPILSELLVSWRILLLNETKPPKLVNTWKWTNLIGKLPKIEYLIKCIFKLNKMTGDFQWKYSC